MVPIEKFEAGAQNLESLSLAYEESLKTYDWSLQRFDTWDGNLDKILAWGSPLSIGMLGAILAKDIPLFQHLFFIAFSSLLIIAAIVCAFWGKQTGEIDLIDPSKRIATWLKLDSKAFRWYAIRDAG
ncbi:MAG TPA: hypothetical protein VG537_11240, partial [Candidatus Kapabacteria bacterium]|nr:hypothetical protein [Candidatus Kapabacteria bacterium]